MKPQELWNKLHAAGLTRQEAMPAIVLRAPWYMEAILFLGLWTGAVLVVCAFVFFLPKESSVMLFLSGVALALACWLFRSCPENFFLGQFAHAASLCGAGLILFVIFQEVTGHETQLRLQLALALLVFCAMNNFVQRLVAASAALSVIAMLCRYYWGDARFLWMEWLYAGCAFAFVLVWQREMKTLRYRRNQIWRGVGYALALFLLAAMNFSFLLSQDSMWIAKATQESARVLSALRVLSGMTLLWLAVWLLRREGVACSSRLALILMSAALGVALLGMEMPFAAVALLILVTGFAASAPVLLGIGALMLLNVFAQYYYWLEVNLLRKSIYLLLTGGILLLCRLALLKIPPRRAEEKEEGEHE
ncbi:MAG: DUF4401 domain-containing protein [Zoogloeaceae bacterium]|jgi:uncharacterized membrane protein|nr:DUF4401 domain-containing protein [Zoogloeaceae bacterium]